MNRKIQPAFCLVLLNIIKFCNLKEKRKLFPHTALNVKKTLKIRIKKTFLQFIRTLFIIRQINTKDLIFFVIIQPWLEKSQPSLVNDDSNDERSNI
jgi:hypothetical protein